MAILEGFFLSLPMIYTHGGGAGFKQGRRKIDNWGGGHVFIYIRV